MKRKSFGFFRHMSKHLNSWKKCNLVLKETFSQEKKIKLSLQESQQQAEV